MIMTFELTWFDDLGGGGECKVFRPSTSELWDFSTAVVHLDNLVFMNVRCKVVYHLHICRKNLSCSM